MHAMHGMRFSDRVRDEMQQRHAKHEAGNEADGCLQAGVSEADPRGHPATSQRGEKRAARVEADHRCGVVHGVTHQERGGP
jgi:hypothetical protein